MKPWALPVQGSASTFRAPALPPLLDELNAAWALLIARIDPMADDSLPDMRARRSPGMAMAAMMPMIATTISSSMSEKPFWPLFLCISLMVLLQRSCLSEDFILAPSAIVSGYAPVGRLRTALPETRGVPVAEVGRFGR